MASINKPSPTSYTHGGGKASRVGSVEELQRAVMTCLLWEDNFYEGGETLAERIRRLVPKVSARAVSAIAMQARLEHGLRHVPLLLCRELARRSHDRIVSHTIGHCIQRADELTEFLALYWADGKCSLSAQVKKGLAAAFGRFDEYQLAKYNRKDKAIKLRDVLRLCHAKPRDSEQGALWRRLLDDNLATPDTWEVALSGGEDKRDVFTRLLGTGKMGFMAILRNLRNMKEAGVPKDLVRVSLMTHKGRKHALPFRFIAAAKAVPSWEDMVDDVFLGALSDMPKIPGRTLIVVDVSGSMYGRAVAQKSDMDRAHAACALAAILREVCVDSAVYATAGNDSTRIHQTKEVPNRRGLPLVDAIYSMCKPLGGGGIFITPVMRWLATQEREEIDRTIVITDEQDCAGHTGRDVASKSKPLGRGYIVNVSTYDCSIGYGVWTHINGWSESVVRYLHAVEGGSNRPIQIA